MNNFEAIDKLTSFDDNEVLEALRTLEKTGNSEILSLIRDLQAHEDPQVREAAQRATSAIQGRGTSNSSSKDYSNLEISSYTAMPDSTHSRFSDPDISFKTQDEQDNISDDEPFEIPSTSEIISSNSRKVSSSAHISGIDVQPTSRPRPISNPLRNPARGSGVNISDLDSANSRPSTAPAQDISDSTPITRTADAIQPAISNQIPGTNFHSKPLGSIERTEISPLPEVREKPEIQLARVDDFLEEIESPSDLPSIKKMAMSEKVAAALNSLSDTSPATDMMPPMSPSRNMGDLMGFNDDQQRAGNFPDFSSESYSDSSSEIQSAPDFVNSSESDSTDLHSDSLTTRTVEFRPSDRYQNSSRTADTESLDRRPIPSIIPDQAPPEILGPIDRILYSAISRSASDIHLFQDSPPLFRIHGDVYFEDCPNLEREVIRSFVRNSLGELEYQRFVEDMEVDLAYQIEGVARFRVNIFNDINGIGMVFRHIPEKIPTMEELKLPQVFKEMCSERKGLVLITGPTGSGKSTTLAAMIDWINRNRRAHILTIEDPVEFVHDPILCKVTHRQVKKNTKTFNSALSSAMRQDPDVILIGEIRDLETVAIALHASETGHLVLGTLHTKNAARTVTRIVSSFPPREQDNIRNQLADGLRGIVAQTLVKTRDGNSRTAAFEVLLPNPAISNLIRKGNFTQIQDAMRSGRSQGMQTFVTAMYDLIKSRRVEVNEAMSHLISHEEREELKSLLKGN
ncbi:MAG: hypothetical protein CVV64_04125 [Candidatus Wallbacteria bacterium HGW-Wallbacteria-1]|jgi:twitching motility protein PilT|uniref:Bacterial type II secretion system protein E domain-containing protein n=1 Tax=Candidatus Wallbacteria bacterium HGW-Wallbacteria-1 TaxID=2013854 RepID=A0A2N1PRJ3_9BACT|nr:MAG: hypothetical protein CVV64_04125 [Candidatus Wallbacteria bacterium HGW-Wallbacteria-1]